MVLGAAKCLRAFAKVGATLVNIVCNWGRANKADCFHIRVFNQGIYSFFVTLDNVKYAIRQASFFQELGHQEGCRWICWAWFEDEGIAAGYRHREHPHRYHHWKVKWSNTGYHSKRLAHDPVIDASRNLFGIVTFHQFRNAGGEF